MRGHGGQDRVGQRVAVGRRARQLGQRELGRRARACSRPGPWRPAPSPSRRHQPGGDVRHAARRIGHDERDRLALDGKLLCLGPAGHDGEGQSQRHGERRLREPFLRRHRSSSRFLMAGARGPSGGQSFQRLRGLARVRSSRRPPRHGQRHWATTLARVPGSMAPGLLQPRVRLIGDVPDPVAARTDGLPSNPEMRGESHRTRLASVIVASVPAAAPAETSSDQGGAPPVPQTPDSAAPGRLQSP